MLSFRNVTVSFILFAISIVIIHYFGHLSFIWLFPLSVLYISVIVYGSAYIGSNIFVPVVCNVVTKKKQIAITFDDGPIERNTDLILDLLKQNNISATFFCIGKRMNENRQLLKRIDEEGHIVGNHSYSHHFFFDFFSTQRLTEELEETNKIAREVIHKEINLFRPPYGVTTPNLAKAIKRGGYKAIGWSIRSMDTVTKDKEKLLNKITKIKPGDIILFHDTGVLTINVLQEFIDLVEQQGYEIVRLDKLLNTEVYD